LEGSDRRREDFEPFWRLLHPRSDRRRSGLADQFVVNLNGNVNFFEKARYNEDGVDENQIVEGGRVSDNNPDLAPKAQSPESGAFTLEVFQGVVEPHLVSLEKAVEFMACLQAEKLAQLRLR
jgi:hypothetical protein